MNAVEKLEAAIGKLEEHGRGYEIINGWLVEASEGCTCAGGGSEVGYAHEGGCGYQPLSSDPLVVTAYRSIEPQLAILRASIQAVHDWLDPDSRIGWEPQDGPHPNGPAFAAVLALADAILGVSDADVG